MRIGIVRVAFGILAVMSGLWGFSLIEEPRIVPRPDYTLGVVFLERWRGDTYVGVEAIIPLDEYLDYSIKEAVVAAWQREARQAMERRELAQEPSGLIPDIELPKLPLLGEGSRIDITGSDRITLGGSQTAVSGVTQTLGSQSLFPELKMEQQLAVSVNGTIGDRTKITIDHNSEREEQQNKIRLQYKGTEDDVIQSVELGDTKLDIPGTSYTGDLPARHGLFGISAKGKLGGVDIYAIASREGSQSSSQSFTGRRRVKTDTIWDVEFVPRRFYRLPGVDSSTRIVNLRIYIDDRNSGNNQAATKGIATVFPDAPDSVVGDSTWWSYDRAGGDFDLKTPGVDYVVQPGNIIEFLTPVERNYIIGAVVYTGNDTIGGQLLRDSLVLCMLKPEVTDSLSRAWNLELRNSYQLPETDVKLNAIGIYRYDPQGQHLDYETESSSPYLGVKFLQILGLDPDGDGKIQYPEFDSKTGIIRFPELEPFASNKLAVRDSIIYRVNPDILPPGAGRKYFLVVSYYTVTETYYLGQTDIMENSEKVYVNGQLKTRNTDYTIDYKTGILTFLTPLPPDADVRVTFEYLPWFSLTQSSLLGTRAEWAFAPNGKIGTSFFYRDEGIQENKPVLGSEPFRRTITETDFAYNVTSDAITAFVDRLPVVWANSSSRFDLRAEGAVSLPNPNTRGVVYLDDFEGTTITRDIPVTALLWSPASVPVGKDTAEFCRTPLRWRNPRLKVRKDSVFGPAIGDEANETQDVLRMIFVPDNTASWAGVMQAPPGASIGMNFTDIENLELIMRSGRNHGKIHISVGMAIDEDAPRRDKNGVIRGYNGRLDTEDKNGNGILEEQEDTGLDGVFGTDSLWTEESPDDGNDDYDPETNQQGTEGNRRLDTEDLDRNGFSRYNHYFEYTIVLDDERLFVPLYHNWRLYRISLRDTTFLRKIGTPKWEDIRVVRIWFDEFDSADTLEIYSLQFVGSKWRDPRITDRNGNSPVPSDTSEKVWVSQVSKKSDTSYNSPFELKRDIAGRLETEASLLLGYRNLDAAHQALVSKATTEGEDYREYQELRWYAHDDGNGLTIFLRLGSDSSNYYEVRTPITSGRKINYGDGRWFEFIVKLDSLPLFKSRRDSLGVPPESIFTIQIGGTLYSVKGVPVLANVRWTALGIENRSGTRLTGAVWFNDLRLTAPMREPGYGLTAQAGFRLADIAAIALRYAYSDPNFRRFSDGRGVKTGGFQQDLGADFRVNLDHIFPRNWKISLPLGYSIARQNVVPKYSPIYPDLRFEDRANSRITGIAHSREFSLTNISKQKSANKFLNYTVEAMNFSWYQRWAGSRRYPYYDSSNAQGWQWRYGVNPDLRIRMGKDKEFYPLPRDIRFTVSRGKRTDIRGDTIRPYPDTLRGDGISGDFNLRFSPIEDLNIEYGWESERDLLAHNPDTVLRIPLGAEGSRNESFNVSYDLEVADIFNPSIEFNGEYNHERPKIGYEYAKQKNLNNSGELALSASFEFAELLEKFASAERRTRSQREPPTERPDTIDTVPPGIKRDTTLPIRRPGKKSPGSGINTKSIATELAKNFEPLEASYTISRNTEYQAYSGVAPWYYRFGFVDTLPIDTAQGRINRTKEFDRNLRLSTGGGYRNLTVRIDYNASWGKSVAFVGAAADRNVIWPDIQVELRRVHNLFSNLATDSRLSSNYRRTQTVRGDLLPLPDGGETLAVFGRNQTMTVDFNPLVAWQTTWRKNISTTVNINYNTTSNISYLSESGVSRSQTDSKTRGANLSLSYAFSAPQGLKLPFLRKVRFSSDLSITAQLRYSQTLREQKVWTEAGTPTIVPQQRDNAYSTTLGASYRFSRAIEAGLNSGYSYNRGLTGITTRRTDLNIWALFRF